RLDVVNYTITLTRPLVLDLGAVAKGLAIDMAAHELAPLRHFAIDAGGDLYLSGRNDDDEHWAVGVRHPRRTDTVFETVRVTNLAVCTSGDYERRDSRGGHHLLDPRAGHAASSLASATVIAGSAMVADALATAAFILGPAAGLEFLLRSSV